MKSLRNPSSKTYYISASVVFFVLAILAFIYGRLLYVASVPKADILDHEFLWSALTFCIIVYLGFRGWYSGTQGKWDLFSSRVIFPTLYLFVYGVGSLNISTYYGLVDYQALFPCVYAGFLGYVLGIALMSLLKFPTSSTKSREWSEGFLRLIVYILVGIGLLSALLIVVRYGIPLLAGINSNDLLIRANVPPTLSMLTRLLWLGVAIYIVHRYSVKHKFDIWMLPILLMTMAVVVLLGYRGYLVQFILFIVISFYYLLRPSRRTLLIIILSVFLATFAVWFVRYSIESSNQIENLAVIYHFPIKSALLFYPYMSVRDSAAISSRIITIIPSSELLKGQLFISDLLTMLPGKQLSGGGLMSELLGGTGIAGITVSIVGGLYVDFGIRGIFLGLFAMGFFSEFLYRRLKSTGNLSAILLYSILLVEMIHFLRRGVFSAAYVWDFLIVFGVTSILDFIGKRKIMVEKREIPQVL